MNYLGRRLVRSVLLLIGVSALCFLFTEMAPGSFFDEMRLNPQISPETIAALRSHYGLDQPLLVRYGRWMKSALHADLGYSIAYNTPVAPLLWSRAKNTLLLTTNGAASDLDDLRSVGRVGGQPAWWFAGQGGQPCELIPRFCSGTCDCGGAARDRSSLANPARRRNDVGRLRGPLRLGEIAGHPTPPGAAGIHPGALRKPR